MESVIPTSRTGETEFSTAEMQRYARHLTIPDVGIEGQKKLKAAKVLCIGAGGLGSPVTMYLAAAGIGEIGLVEFDTVEFSNLQRQIVHGTGDVGKPKIDSAMASLAEINPEVKVTPYATRLTSENAMEIAAPYDLIIDGTDNFETRYLSNDLAVLTKKPNVYGSIFRFEGQVSVFAPHLGGPCYRCLFPTPPEPGQVPSCAEGGVLGVLPGIVGSLQANEAIKLILGIGEPLIGRLVHFDALAFRFREIKLRKDSECAVCGTNPTITELKEIEFTCAMSDRKELREIDVHQLKKRIERDDQFILLDVREPAEVEVAKIDGSVLIPLGELPDRLGELHPREEIIIHCKAGGRSAQALKILMDANFTDVCHVQGGINAWSLEVDSSVPHY
ncbi:molybdopterin-synthase adenylyltransferase MoeB [Verrucomicrobiales bacterium BCK34]|nr:molybdopterin-synthase adenylyltransferase MoeB [Verrucomicrobiales bacterium BCK34]